MSNAKSSLKIAIAGLGVVGAEVARQVINRSDVSWVWLPVN